MTSNATSSSLILPPRSALTQCRARPDGRPTLPPPTPAALKQSTPGPQGAGQASSCAILTRTPSHTSNRSDSASVPNSSGHSERARGCGSPRRKRADSGEAQIRSCKDRCRSEQSVTLDAYGQQPNAQCTAAAPQNRCALQSDAVVNHNYMAACISPFFAGASCWGGHVPSANGAKFDFDFEPVCVHAPSIGFLIAQGLSRAGNARQCLLAQWRMLKPHSAAILMHGVNSAPRDPGIHIYCWLAGPHPRSAVMLSMVEAPRRAKVCILNVHSQDVAVASPAPLSFPCNWSSLR